MRRPRLDSRVEQLLRARRAEAPDALVATVASGLGRHRQTFGPRVRWGLAGAFVVAMIGASVSAGIPGPPGPPASPDATTTFHSTDSHSSEGNGNGNGNEGNGNGNGGGEGDHEPPPSHDQYKGRCGGPPRKICTVDVDPKHPNVKDGASATLTATVLPDHTDCTFTVHYQTSDGTGKHGATTPEDYPAQSGNLVFSPGVDSVSFTISTTSDSGKESESFFVNFTIPSGSAACAQMGVSQVEIQLPNSQGHGE